MIAFTGCIIISYGSIIEQGASLSPSIPMSAWLALAVWAVASTIGIIVMRKITKVNWITLNFYINLLFIVGAGAIIAF